MRGAASIVLLCMVATGCAADAPRGGGWAGTVDTLPNGTVRVVNAVAGVWRGGEGWRLVEELRIGTLDGSGPDAFGQMMSMSLAVDGAGTMYVLDGQSSEIRVFDASGSHVRTFGRPGSGPGEMRAGWIAGWSAGGDLLITDSPNGRYTAWSPAGEFVASHPRAISYSMLPWPGGTDVEGRIYDIGTRRGERAARVLIRVDPATATMDTFALPAYEGPRFEILNEAGLPAMATTIPFTGQLTWKLDPRGYIWSAVTDRYRIVQQALAGDTVLIIEGAGRPLPVTPQERAEALDNLRAFVEAGGRIDASRIPSTKPVLIDFVVDDSGHVWVLPLRNADASQLAFDVFDPSGRYLGEVPTPVQLSTFTARPVFRGDRVYGFVRGEMDVPYLVRLRIEGRSAMD